MMPEPLLFLGIMSGSSLDGVDVALVKNDGQHCNVVATYFSPYPDALKSTLLKLHTPSHNELELSLTTSNAITQRYADAVNTLLNQQGLSATAIEAIGCHGQTVRHRPELGFTLQIINGALLAELTHISVVSDFRSRDIAANGQGAPLVPAFHQAAFGSPVKNRAIVNIGGITNISYLHQSGSVSGFDTGPGNLLLDGWVKRQLGKSYDANGSWSSNGRVNKALLEKMVADPYFTLSPPKSTGRDLFNDQWLNGHMPEEINQEDVARTLVELTATTLCQSLKQHCGDFEELYICGGGAHNSLLIDRIKQLLPDTPVLLTDALGIDADWVEAAAFAWLAQQTMEHKPGNLPSATGANGPRILGAIYPA